MSLLINHGADATQRDALLGGTFLHWTIQRDYRSVIELLLNNHCDINALDDVGWTALNYAIYYQKTEIVKLLVKNSADVNKGPPAEPVPLIKAVRSGQLDIVTLLSTHGADVNGRDPGGKTPLMTALFSDYTELFRVLINFGADVNLCNNTGFSAIHTATCNTPLALACHGGYQSIALKLLELNANVNNTDNELDTPLHFAANRGLVETCKRLVELGADPNARNSTSITPLWNAVFSSSRSVVKFLLELNVSMSVATCGMDLYNRRALYSEPKTPLYVAFDQCEDPYIAAMFIISGVNLSEEKWLQSTDLEVFCKSPSSAHHVDLLRSYTESPVSLQRLCRDEIRRRLATCLTDALPLFDLPASLTDYILIKHDLKKCKTGSLDLQKYKFD